MKIQELIETLTELKEEHGDDIEVCLAYEYGDHWRTQVAPKVGSVDVGETVYSEYHSMERLTRDDDDERKKTLRVVIQ